MSFLHPWMVAIGAAAVALPILVHWLTRPRPVRLPLSTIRFVQEAVRQRRARHVLRDILVLALRALAVLLLGWAFARPLIGQQPLVSPQDDVKAARVIVLDVSQSMGALAGGIESFQRARSTAAGYLISQPGLQSNLVLAGASARPVFETFSRNFAAQVQELSNARVRPERLNVQAAIVAAAELLANAAAQPGQRRELVIISDFQRSNWATADFSVLPRDTSIQFESVAPGQSPGNFGIVRCTIQGRAEPQRPVRLEVEVANDSATARQVQVEVSLGPALYKIEGLCPPTASTVLSTDVSFEQPGWLAGQARLLDLEDALPADNLRPMVVQVRPAPVYAMVSRLLAEPRASSSYFLARALAPRRQDGSEAAEKVLWVAPNRADRESLAGADLIVLDHPGRLTAETIDLLAAQLRHGRGVLYAACEDADAINLRALADAAGSDLQLPVEFMPVSRSQRRADLFLADTSRDQAPFRVFGDELPAVIGPLRFAGGLATRRLPTGLADDILASFNDQSACLVCTMCGMGTLAVLNADLEASNLPRSPAFVPLLAELVGRMHGSDAGRSVPCGEPMVARLPAEAGAPSGLELLASAGPEITDLGDLAEDGTGVLWQWRSPGAPGVYQVQRGPDVVYALAAAVPAEESDLRPLAAGVLKDRLAGGRNVYYRGPDSDKDGREDAWPWFAVACMLCLLAEVVALRVFRS